MSVCTITKDDVTYELSLLNIDVDGMPACKKDKENKSARTREIIVEKCSGTAMVYAWPSLTYLVDDSGPVSFADFNCWEFKKGAAVSNYMHTVSLSTPGVTEVVLKINGIQDYKVTITVVEIGEWSFDKTVIPANGSVSAVPQSVSIQPAGRTLKWMDVWNAKLGMPSICSINPTTGVVTGTGEGGRVLVRVYDEEFPACYREESLDILQIESVGFDAVAAVADGGSVQASAKVYPADRTLVWSIEGNSLGCTINSSTGVLTPGNETGTVTVKVKDSEYEQITDTASIDICSQCMEGKPIAIGNVTLENGKQIGGRTVYCYGEEPYTLADVVAKVKLTGECCDGVEYDGDMEMEIDLDSMPGIHDNDVAILYVCGTWLQAKAPKYTVVKMGPIQSCPAGSVCKGEHLLDVMVDPCPDTTSIGWKIVKDSNTSDSKAKFLSSTGKRVELDTNWGNRAIKIEVFDQSNPSCKVEGTVNVNNQVPCSACEGGPTLLAACSNKGSLGELSVRDGLPNWNIPFLA